MFTCFNVLEIHYFSYTDTLITVALIQDTAGQTVSLSFCIRPNTGLTFEALGVIATS